MTLSRSKIRIALMVFLLAVAAAFVSVPRAAQAAVPYQPPTPTSTVSSTGTVRIHGDQHDGEVVKVGSEYYLYGTAYGCGFTWGVHGTPFCGFYASSAPSLSGPWSKPVQLFSPASKDPHSGLTWQNECGGNGNGCFNARMLQRTGWGGNDGVNILWFNSPRDGDNAYNAMGCTGPLGPCGVGAPKYGSYHKPNLWKAYGNGDFGFIASGNPNTSPVIVSSIGAGSLGTEQIDKWGTNGTAVGQSPAFKGSAEGVGGWYDTASGKYVMTYSDPQCGYCAGVATGFSTSSSAATGWSVPGNVGVAAPAAARRDFSSASCGGQPRTVTVLDSQPYEVIDLWRGTLNETKADSLLVPLKYNAPAGTAGDGQSYVPPVQFGSCS